MAEDVWYYEKDGQQYGPVSHAELQRLIESGYLSRHNLAWRPGEKDWSASGTFHDLAASFKTPPPVQKPPSAPLPPPPPPQTQPPQSQQQPHEEKQEPNPRPPWYERLGSGISWTWNALTKINEFFDGRPGRFWAAVLLAVLGPSIIIIERTVIQPAREESRQLAQIEAPKSTLPGTRVPVGYTGPVGQIKIDAYPWAQVTKFSSGEQGNLAILGGESTPLVLLVAPGSYRIEFDGGKQSCDVVIAEEQSRSCQRIIRTVDSTTYYQEIGW